MQRSQLKDKIRQLPQASWLWCKRLDERFWWAKFVLLTLFILLSTLMWGRYTFSDYWLVEQRRATLQREINSIKPQLTADSLRLVRVKELGREVEAIARERYLMKSPGEEIFIIKSDSNTTAD